MDLEIMELLSHLAKEHEPGTYDLDDEGSLEEFLYDYYNIDIESFTDLIEDLLPLCDKEKSPLTGKLYQGFGTDNYWLICQKVEQ